MKEFFSSLRRKANAVRADFTVNYPIETRIEHALTGQELQPRHVLPIERIVLRQERGTLNVYLESKFGTHKLADTGMPVEYWVNVLVTGERAYMEVNGLFSSYVTV